MNFLRGVMGGQSAGPQPSGAETDLPDRFLRTGGQWQALEDSSSSLQGPPLCCVASPSLSLLGPPLHHLH
ncbi:UNVERIFIED_CONTAM: hypothetical protein K2H54_057045 [Gekko kuhli]